MLLVIRVRHASASCMPLPGSLGRPLHDASARKPRSLFSHSVRGAVREHMKFQLHRLEPGVIAGGIATPPVRPDTMLLVPWIKLEAS
jgi:hypothetical protein